ncbi:MAG: polysaccharide deacetylase [Clostridia bacterium]|nr:polysaccharide deacetylase [Clostridia bacterium]
MKRLTGTTIAILLALLFVLISAGIGVGAVVRGVRDLRGEEPVRTTQVLQLTTETATRKTTTTTKKTTTKKPSTTKKTTAAKKTAAAKKTTTAKKTAMSQKTTTTKKATTSKKTTTQKKTTAKKTTTKKASTTKKALAAKKTTQKADGSKVIYLTFDDGPGPYTDKLLDILDEYGVKATFFVTNCCPDYQACIAKEYRAGHAVAVHTYSHDYSRIYRSTSAYWADFNRMNDLVKKQTGKPTIMFRFPGGSSNTVSRNYKSGIMTKLVRQAGEKGLTYYDWNVSCGDAGGADTSEEVYRNIVRAVKEQKKSIVLCHDVKSYTVNAMDKTIRWCLDHGYTFEVLVPGGYTVHHGVSN